jgi:opacity protein-like surface antigen
MRNGIGQNAARYLRDLARTGFALACASGFAQAADLPLKAVPATPSVYNWTGFYGGVHAGYGMGMKDWPRINGSFPNSPFVFTDGPFDYDVKGFLGGGQIGVTQQIGNFVVGIEADASWADIKGGQTVLSGGFSNPTTHVATTRIDRLMTVAGRLGFAQDRWVVYAKAGAAWAHENHGLTSTSNLAIVGGGVFTLSTATSGSETRLGPVLGFGAEYALWGNWSFKSEYNYLHLLSGSARFTGTQTLFGPTSFDASIQQAFHLVKLGLNYRFGPEPGPAIAPARPALGYDWTGSYVGAQAAYGFGRKEWEVGREGHFDVSGALAGGVTGTNVQAGVFVFGAESEWLWSGVRGSTRFTTPFSGGSQSTDLATKIDWLSLSSVRAGFVAADRWLFYFKGGVALAREAHAVGAIVVAPGFNSLTDANATALHTGYLAGAGVEYAFLDSWSARLEYNFVDFRSQHIVDTGFQANQFGGGFGVGAFSQRDTINQNIHLVKFGVNYHFNGLPDIVSAKY